MNKVQDEEQVVGYYQQQQLLTVVHKELLKCKGINTEALSRYWTCKTLSKDMVQAQFHEEHTAKTSHVHDE